MDVKRLPAPLERVTQTFSGRTVEVLRDLVLDGTLRPGERLNEVELATALGISRGPLREAIQRLHSVGLLTTIPNRGAYVRTFTPHQLRELYEVRIALETHAVRLAAKASKQQSLQKLQQMLDDTDLALADAGQEYPRDLDFHRQFVALADNQALMDAATDIYRQIELARARSAHDPARARRALREHREVLEQLSLGKGDRAATILAKHLRTSLENALELLDFDGPAVARG